MGTPHVAVASNDAVDASAGARRLAWSVTETADLLGVSEDLIYQMIARRELPCLRVGRRVLVPARAIEMVMEASLAGFDPANVVQRLCQGTVPGAGCGA